MIAVELWCMIKCNCMAVNKETGGKLTAARSSTKEIGARRQGEKGAALESRQFWRVRALADFEREAFLKEDIGRCIHQEVNEKRKAGEALALQR